MELILRVELWLFWNGNKLEQLQLCITSVGSFKGNFWEDEVGRKSNTFRGENSMKARIIARWNITSVYGFSLPEKG